MLFLVVIAFIVVANTIIGSIYKRNRKSKELKRKFDLEINTLVTYENLIFAIILSAVAAYLLYDKSTKSLDIYSIVIIILIIVVSAFRIITQKYYNPIIADEGILFYNGVMLPWGGVNEIKVISKDKVGSTVVLIGGKISNTAVAREKIIIKQAALKSFENLISSKTTLK